MNRGILQKQDCEKIVHKGNHRALDGTEDLREAVNGMLRGSAGTEYAGANFEPRAYRKFRCHLDQLHVRRIVWCLGPPI